MYDPFVVKVFDSAGDGPHDFCCVAASRVEPRQTFRGNEAQQHESGQPAVLQPAPGRASNVPLVIIPLAAKPINELSTGTQVKDEVEVMSGLKVVDETADVRVTGGDSFEDGDLVSDLPDSFRWGGCVRSV
jgi:hypothetical protein